MDNLISVIVPVFNASRFIKESINSIQNQSFKNLEILICDDCSIDNSWEIVKDLSNFDQRIKLYKNQENIGYLRTINFLVSVASGKYLAFQDADDVSHPERLKKQINFFKKNLDYGIVGTNYIRISERGRNIGDTVQLSSSDIQLKNELRERNPFMKPSIMFTSDVLAFSGMYREEFLEIGNISEDFDWILRVSEKFKVANINDHIPLYYYRSVPTAMTKVVENVDRFFGTEICLRLAKERKLNGIDSIESSNLHIIEEWKTELRKPFLQNRNLIFEKLYAIYLYSKLNNQAILISLKLIIRKPFNITYWKKFIVAVKGAIT
ncbi:glycosyltransferase family 2 protein [Marivirga arenosa]|uniref:Glycosyltransferase family 2 protein n=1 Tax=Marivirga arenosa TaxID=3059076 RepID=A0AA51ZWJ8_9BACT|nr:glycosyltransferase family 2 protein [Marivirga sp. BKB1-2]WNB18070.1 glycosyltransferase family 2 protein [Marivirga sp. BKB1-2]